MQPYEETGETLQQRLWKQAEEALAYARNSLIVKMRFLDTVLCRLRFTPVDDPDIMEQYPCIDQIEGLAMNGERLFYNSRFVLERFFESDELLIHDYLHMIMHCIFKHPFENNIHIPLWDMACDIAVENVIEELCSNEINSGGGGLGVVTYDENASARRSELQVLREKLKVMSAEKIYKHYQHLTDDEIEVKRSIFKSDEHDLWYVRAAAGSGIGGDGDQDGEGNNDETSGQNSRDRNRPGQNSMSREDLRKMWEDASRQVQMDLETFSKNCGRETGGLQRNLEDVNRERYDYTEFLHKFAVRHEAMKINDDEFDYIPYVFGLMNYDNMPFVEPLEYKEVKKIRDFVIAIDTSGSTYFTHAHYFIQKTYNILKSTESFASRVNVHIVQCDTRIQRVDKISSLSELEEYLKTMTINGGGGTVLQPVFDYVEKQVKNKEFTNLKGIIFFTDGYAVFPKREPDFLTAFVLLDEGLGGAFKPPEMPPWAITLILEEEQLM